MEKGEVQSSDLQPVQQQTIQCTQSMGTGNTAVCPSLQNIRGDVNITVQASGDSQQNLHRLDEKASCLDIAQLSNHQKKALKEKVEYMTEYTSRPGEKACLTEKFTKLWVTDGERNEIPQGHEVMDIEAMSRQTISDVPSVNCSEIFSYLSGQVKPPRMVVTKGIAGIGKTICVQKFIHDWATGTAAPQFDLIFMFPFRELNLLTEIKLSLTQLVQQYYPHIEHVETILTNQDIKCLFIFDGLDESNLPLDFRKSPEIHNVKQTMQLQHLLTNLIKGNLLPSASLWITSRPAAVTQIPAPYIDRVTEIQGFRDEEKEEYFRKKCKEVAESVLSHVRNQPSLFTMCYVPAFCWILATVLEHSLKSANQTQLDDQAPKTITEVYTNFLIVMITYHQEKHGHGINVRKRISEFLHSNRSAILRLGRLAFHCLKAQNLLFYEKDLRAFGVDMSLVCDGFCKEILLQEEAISQKKAYFFIHLTVQEYFAALYVYISYHTNNHHNPLATTLKRRVSQLFSSRFSHVCKNGCQEAVRSRTGHLDLFLRFLCGLSTEKNQTLLEGLTTWQAQDRDDAARTAAYIKKTLQKDILPDRCLNLLHCLNELNDHSVLEKVKESLSNGALASRNLTPAEYSALAFLLQTSGGDMEEFDLIEYNTSLDLLWRLLPVAKLFRIIKFVENDVPDNVVKFLSTLLITPRNLVQELWLQKSHVDHGAVKQLCAALRSPHCNLQSFSLSGNELSVESCQELALTLSTNCTLRQLDLAHNQLKDQHLIKFCGALKGPQCGLQTLCLSRNQITKNSCEGLASILKQSQTLTILNLANNQIGDCGVKELCAALKEPGCKLQTLSLKHNSLTHVCCEDLASALRENSQLIDLDCSANYIMDSGVKLLCAGLKAGTCRIQYLRFSSCDLSAKCCEDLVSALVALRTVKGLDLHCNCIGDSGVKNLCGALRHQHVRIQELGLKGNYLTDKCCSELISALCAANAVRIVDLSFNGFTDETLGHLHRLMVNCSSLNTVNLHANQLGLESCKVLQNSLKEVRANLELCL
ncbi:NLR family CARD domain-containing protein 3-like isoform X2 [Heptranchias perlo]|uniref:NLR family CARD domain-containing protein 3-like isoform X2 n=1 Tax=Heptranchias perlo TaxID=212740 RepID=UPI00355AC931